MHHQAQALKQGSWSAAAARHRTRERARRSVGVGVGVGLALVVALLTPACLRDAGAGRAPVPAPTAAAAIAPGPDAGRDALGPKSRNASSTVVPDTAGASGRGESGPAPLEVDDLRREMAKARGKILFVHLWATWCGPCLEELPLVERFARAARARGGVVLSVSLDNDPRGIARVPAVLQARAPGLTPAVARFDDPDQFMSLFSKSWEGTIPALFAFDRAGKLQASLIGEVEPAELEALLKLKGLGMGMPAPGSDRRPAARGHL